MDRALQYDDCDSLTLEADSGRLSVARRVASEGTAADTGDIRPLG